MTTVEISLPDDLARRAESAGLLSDAAIQRLLEDAVRRRVGHALLDVARQIQSAAIPPMTDDEIMVEVEAARAGRRAREATVTGMPDGAQDKPVDMQAAALRAKLDRCRNRQP
jgi:hypothetical protein